MSPLEVADSLRRLGHFTSPMGSVTYLASPKCASLGLQETDLRVMPKATAVKSVLRPLRDAGNEDNNNAEKMLSGTNVGWK